MSSHLPSKQHSAVDIAGLCIFKANFYLDALKFIEHRAFKRLKEWKLHVNGENE